jgi:hypothetical protein
MTALQRYLRSVERLERQAALNGTIHPAVIRRLINVIRAQPWHDGDERGEAQMLVYRLERLRLQVA